MSNYMAIEVFVAGEGDSDHLVVKSDTLDGERGVVALVLKDKNGKGGEEILGFFKADQLISAIQAVASMEMPYLSDNRPKKRKPLEYKAPGDDYE